MTLEKALERYLAAVTPSKKPTTRKAEASKAKQLIQHLGKYSLAALSAEVIATAAHFPKFGEVPNEQGGNDLLTRA